ncbi:isoleucine--tRNA ligase [Phycisphaera mikurensis]|uniref:Isoleucine--tRNA ligase n=1 Tax=Phycisphaera mikurensis (strain NBRC 102666 / KCTC 22515 / FYK2301M01) TaxID=1142394 RepID=I0IDB3_PHYMF|nr:isoleucine--tRNA ligase [Phycisphaera mikurensis]MBB6442376.1 isoleucyl-tRNA synthetase [Phycisphaera mikurensis]BAM03251.1 isoleucyl-tRNA synthetase [Phycisphaera mikurensis NBRC 102666]
MAAPQEKASAKKAGKNAYKDTLNLPRTAFAMKANLVQSEPQSVKRWAKLGVYRQLRARAAEAKAAGDPLPAYVAHDGPPYANGDIHLGHLLNKVLKDLVVRSRSMEGFDCPYTPGWDCHGLPIEHRVMQELGPGGRELEPLKIRRKCAAYAGKHVKTQRQQMERLLTLADYENPYLTMDSRYEAGVLEVFAGMLEAGLVYRDLKPVHWSVDNQTALAEAELEYHDREDTSVYVRFAMNNSGSEGLLIWTTTPWTLPANLAVAVHPRMEYGLYEIAGNDPTWIAVALAPAVAAKREVGLPGPLKVVKGEALVGRTYAHPFVGREGRVVPAEYVTDEDGTGLVHTAPGHGAEDYQTGLREGLDVYCPVLPDGTYDDTVPDWLRGKSIWEANQEIVERLERDGVLFFDERFTHSYPHDWRGKQPVIFRATEQWFCAVDKPATGPLAGKTLRQAGLDAVGKDTSFQPAWGQNRLRGMIESRPDWCLSRQRSWGLPIPAFFDAQGRPLLTAASVRAVAEVIGDRGSDAWFFLPAADLLARYDPAADPDAPAWAGDDALASLVKGGDTFDVWFESGSSWHAVLREGWREAQAEPASGEAFPADLYLEGSDQHRGWFQHSLLPALAVTGRPPFEGVLTHGFMVDRDGRKMSKSLGNALEVATLMQQHGADVCRWWVASLNTDNDVKVDEAFFKTAGEAYRKVRNTLRFLLSNLDGFRMRGGRVKFEAADATSLDAWLTGELVTLSVSVRRAYRENRYRRAQELLFGFCNETLSGVYLSAVKDRLYCDEADGRRRRRTQTTLYRVTTVLVRLLGPILPHTADEAWAALHPDDDEACVHLCRFADVAKIAETPVSEAWPAVMEARKRWMLALEQHRERAKACGGADAPLDLGLVLPAAELPEGFDPVELADLCGVSRVEVGEAEEVAVVDLSRQPRCERSWKRDGTVKPRPDNGLLSDRDWRVVSSLHASG